MIFCVSGIPEADISWGESERLVSNGSSILNSWDADIYQVCVVSD